MCGGKRLSRLLPPPIVPCTLSIFRLLQYLFGYPAEVWWRESHNTVLFIVNYEAPRGFVNRTRNSKLGRKFYRRIHLYLYQPRPQCFSLKKNGRGARPSHFSHFPSPGKSPGDKVGICITVVYGVSGRSQPGFFVFIVFWVNRIQSEKTKNPRFCLVCSNLQMYCTVKNMNNKWVYNCTICNSDFSSTKKFKL